MLGVWKVQGWGDKNKLTHPTKCLGVQELEALDFSGSQGAGGLNTSLGREQSDPQGLSPSLAAGQLSAFHLS